MGNADERPRRFRFAARMSAEPDLARRSGEILRQEMGRVVAWPGSPDHHAKQKATIEHLLAIATEVEKLLEKRDEYKRRGYERIGLGALDRLSQVARGQ